MYNLTGECDLKLFIRMSYLRNMKEFNFSTASKNKKSINLWNRFLSLSTCCHLLFEVIILSPRMSTWIMSQELEHYAVCAIFKMGNAKIERRYAIKVSDLLDVHLLPLEVSGVSMQFNSSQFNNGIVVGSLNQEHSRTERSVRSFLSLRHG